MYPGDQRRMDDHLLQAALLDGAAQDVEMAVVERIEGAEEHPDAAAWGRDRADVRQQADADEHGAEHEARDQKHLAGSRDAGGANGCPDEITWEAEPNVTVWTPDDSLEQITC